MRLTDYVIEFLEERGIDHVFTVAGGGAAFLNDALRKAKRMRYVCTHHEQAAAFAAEAYARVRNGLGCAVVTSGPGGTNAVTGVAAAWLDHVPVIFISGQTFLKQTVTDHPGLRTLGVQEINIVDIVRPITKYAVMMKEPSEIGFHLGQAVYEATSGRPGPSWLDVPANIQSADIDVAQLVNYGAPRQWPSIALVVAVSQVIDMLRGAKRPLIHVGQGVRIAGAEQDFFSFVEASCLPFVTARNANDICDSTHPLFIGRPGTFGQRGANFAVQTCDLYLAIGTRLSLAQTGYNSKDYARNAKIVVVDIDRAELSKGMLRDPLLIQADARVFLDELIRQLFVVPLPNWSAWLARCKALQRRYPVVLSEYERGSGPVNIYHFADVLSHAARADDAIVTDMGLAFQTTNQAWMVKLGQRLMTNCGLAPMGWGLPAAVGACIGSGRRTICIVGDGGFMMNVQELATVVHHELPIKIFVLNNGGYLTMRQSQDFAFGARMGSDRESGISFPHFGKLAAAYGIAFTRIESNLHLLSSVENVLNADGPQLCEIMADPNQEQAPKAMNRREADGTIRQMAIEDAYPFLDPAEIAENMRIDQ